MLNTTSLTSRDQAYREGRDDFIHGRHLNQNRYARHTSPRLHEAWHNGWCDAADEYNRKYASHNATS